MLLTAPLLRLARLQCPVRRLHLSRAVWQAYTYPYNVAALESRWIRATAQSRPTPAANGSKYYMLSMFPYPSGNLHMGHVRVYTISDMLARYRRMRGDDVLHPMGWDAFGLPAENAAIERGISPRSWTRTNIAQMRQQLQGLATDFDWDKEVTTCESDYYKHTQFLFVKLLEAGYAYQRDAVVNWDPVDQTVLANEQVDAEGRSWRSGALVEQRKLRQWFLRTTHFAEVWPCSSRSQVMFADSLWAKELLRDLDRLQWPEKVKQMQRNWIGKSTGLVFRFLMANSDVAVYTTRPETVFGVTFIAVGPGHPLLQSVPAEHRQSVVDAEAAYQQQQVASSNEALAKEGVYTGVKVRNPLTDAVVPVYLTNYVVSEYGTGAVMGVPAHDERDFDFAAKHDIPVQTLLQGGDSAVPDTGNGVLNHLCQDFEGITCDEARQIMIERAESGQLPAQYRLRDWLISRQRYWGAPIPVVHCKGCGAVPVPVDQLPVLLPDEVQLTGRGHSPLAALDHWVNCQCPKCGGQARRETDTMDTFVDSSWYFLRYTDSHNVDRPFSKAAASASMPVDLYVGGIEHAILHLLYARFFTKFVNQQGMASIPHGEPFRRLLTQGMVHGRTCKDPATGRYLRKDELDLTDPANPLYKGQAPLITHEKMSKSKHNGVAPEDVISNYGADVTRLYILSKAPPEDVLEWDDQAIVGLARWISRVWRLVDARVAAAGALAPATADDVSALNDKEQQLWQLTHQTIKEITNALEETHAFNTIPSHLIKLTHGITALQDQLPPERQINRTIDFALVALVQLMSPLAPCMGQELWSRLHHNTADAPLLFGAWPAHQHVQARLTTCAIQVNGKMRGVIDVPEDKLDDIAAFARHHDVTQKWIGGKHVKKVIVVKNGKLVNFVV
ncbi:Leucyl-tRNA synthetase, mitochondrial [Sorochytrium milnesiophthora]